MKIIHGLTLLAASLSLFAAGCGWREQAKRNQLAEAQAAADKEEAAEIEASLAKLSPEDRKLAEAQKFCAVQNGNLLGSMDTPVKLTIKGKPVFLCCGHCKKTALKDPDKTLAAVERLKERVAKTSGK